MGLALKQSMYKLSYHPKSAEMPTLQSGWKSLMWCWEGEEQ